MTKGPMNRIILITPFTLALLSAPAFAGNEKDYRYLALGDSIPFGMNLTLMLPFRRNFPLLPISWDFPKRLP